MDKPGAASEGKGLKIIGAGFGRTGVEIPKGKPFPHLNDRDNFGGNRLREQQS